MGRSIHKAVTEAKVVEACERALTTLDNPGFCITCGEEADGCEPDAQAYTCDSCGQRGVYGAEELLMRGWYNR